MPVPVYLLFSFRLLAEEGTLFTKGRLMSLSEVGRTADFLRRIEFTNVYHDSGVGVPGSDRRAVIPNARHAEVLVANLLSLDHLRFVVCRSQAERDTLLSLLDGSTRSLWIRKIVVDEGPRRLFYRRATYVNGVSLAADSSRFEFSADSEVAWRGPFDLRIEWTSGDWRVAYSDRNFVASAQPLQISLRTERSHYVANLTLNGDLVYLGTFHQTYGFDLPF